jgi:hypothetical protein
MTSREWRSLDTIERQTIERFQNETPIRVSEIARALGLAIRASTLPPGISGEIRPDRDNPGRFIIKVSRHDSSARQRFTVAHEIGHYLLHREQIGNGIVDDALYRSGLSDRREAEANRIAADILMPNALVDAWLDRARVLGVEDTATYLKQRFEVSDAAMKIRLGLS